MLRRASHQQQIQAELGRHTALPGPLQWRSHPTTRPAHANVAASPRSCAPYFFDPPPPPFRADGAPRAIGGARAFVIHELGCAVSAHDFDPLSAALSPSRCTVSTLPRDADADACEVLTAQWAWARSTEKMKNTPSKSPKMGFWDDDAANLLLRCKAFRTRGAITTALTIQLFY